MRGNDATHYLNEKGSAKLWTAHMSKITNEKNEWDQIADADTVVLPVKRVMKEDILEVYKHFNIGLAQELPAVHA